MDRTKTSIIHSIVFALAISLLLAFPAVGAENPPVSQQTSEDLLLKIMAWFKSG
jgi:hypothetical protein